MKKFSFVLGIIGSGLPLFQNLWSTIQFLLTAGTIDFTNIDTFSPLIYSVGMVLLSAAALIGALLVFRKHTLSGILLCVFGFLMFLFGLMTFGIIPLIPFLLLIAAGVLALMSKEEDTKPPAD